MRFDADSLGWPNGLNFSQRAPGIFAYLKSMAIISSDFFGFGARHRLATA
jgi:hypothetical protein